MSVPLNSIGFANYKEENWRGTCVQGLFKHTALIELEVTFATNLAIVLL